MSNDKWILELLDKIEDGYVLDDKAINILKKKERIDWGSLQLKRLPNNIGLLSSLKELILWDNSIEYLPNEITDLQNLTDLILQDNKLKELPKNFHNLTNLRTLYLGRNPWKIFPNEIRYLSKLVQLDLQGCIFDELPEWILDFNLPFTFTDYVEGINLTKTVLKTQHISLFEQSRESIFQYYQRLRENGQIIREAKVIFLGDGSVGKTYTIDRIIKRQEQLIPGYDTNITKGVSITHKDFVSDDKGITLHFWDFGGQQIMHSMHRCFLTNNTVYIVMLSGRAEDMQRRLDYWMTGINTFTEGNCPVIVLENRFIGKPTQSINTEQAKRRYSNIQKIFSFSSKDALDIEFLLFQESIINLALNNSRYGKKIGGKWVDIKKKLEKSNEPYLTERQYIDICPNEMTEDERTNVLTWFNDLGVSFSYHKDTDHLVLHEYVVLNPEWATNAIYAIITNGQLWSQNGMLTHYQIEDILKHKEYLVNQGSYIKKLDYCSAEIIYILALMERFRIAYRVSNKIEFIPSLCSNNESKLSRCFISKCDLHYELQYSYLPMNILHGLMIDLYSDLSIGQSWWYSGAFFISKAYRCQALIIQEETQNSDSISIYIKQEQSGEAWRYLQEIRRILLESGNKLHIIANEYIIYKSDGTSELISLKDVLTGIDIGWKEYRSTIFKKEIPYSDILRTFTAPEIANAIVQKGNILEIIIAGCSRMQKRAAWLPPDENSRNDYLCDMLRSADIIVLDQTRSGIANKKSGEIDFLILDSKGKDKIIIEAINLKYFNRQNLQNHITKLMSTEAYNVSGLQQLFFIIYLETKNYNAFCDKYEIYLQNDVVYPNGFNLINIKKLDASIGSISVWELRFTNNTTVYHMCIKLSVYIKDYGKVL